MFIADLHAIRVITDDRRQAAAHARLVASATTKPPKLGAEMARKGHLDSPKGVVGVWDRVRARVRYTILESLLPQ